MVALPICRLPIEADRLKQRRSLSDLGQCDYALPHFFSCVLLGIRSEKCCFYA